MTSAIWGRKPARVFTRRSAAKCCASNADTLRLRERRGQGRRGGRPHAQKAGSRAAQPAAQCPRRRAPFLVGHACATSFTTPPFTCKPLPRPHAMWTWRMRWGFGMKQGPFELWQEAGWRAGGALDAGRHRRRPRRCAKAPLPQWVFKGPVAEAGGVHTPQGSWSPADRAASCRRAACRYTCTPVSPRRSDGHRPGAAARRRAHTVHEDNAIRLWTLDESSADHQHQDQDARHQPGCGRRPGTRRSTLAEQQFEAMVIWSGDEPFSAGADLQAMLPAFMAAGRIGHRGSAEGMSCSRSMLRLRYASVPVVSVPSVVWLWAAAASWPSTARAAWRQWRATSAWWRWAWAWCPAPAAWPTSRAAPQKTRKARPQGLAAFPDRRLSPQPPWPRWAPVRIEITQLGYLLDSRPDRGAQGRAAVRRPA
jgi:hypothetical protein